MADTRYLENRKTAYILLCNYTTAHYTIFDNKTANINIKTAVCP